MAPTWPPRKTRVLDETFPTMGTVARVVRDSDGGVSVASVFAEIDRRLSRFDAGSDLARLNADPRVRVPAAPMLRAAVAAALRSASMSGGLVDPTLLGPLRRAGYADSRARTPNRRPCFKRSAPRRLVARQPRPPRPHGDPSRSTTAPA